MSRRYAEATQAFLWLLRRRLRPVPPGGRSSRPPGALRRRRFLNLLPHLDTPPARTLSQSSVQENSRAQVRRDPRPPAARPVPPCGRRRAPRSPPSGPIPGERGRFRPLAPPVAVWAACWGRCADVAAAAGSRAVGRRWAWRCAGLVRQACGLPCVQPRLARGPARRALTRWCAARGGEAVWCAGRRCRLGGAARHAASPVRAAPDRRPAGRRPRAVPAR